MGWAQHPPPPECSNAGGHRDRCHLPSFHCPSAKASLHHRDCSPRFLRAVVSSGGRLAPAEQKGTPSRRSGQTGSSGLPGTAHLSLPSRLPKYTRESWPLRGRETVTWLVPVKFRTAPGTRWPSAERTAAVWVLRVGWAPELGWCTREQMCVFSPSAGSVPKTTSCYLCCVPQNAYAEALAPGNWECDCIWRQGLYRGE